MTDSTNDGTRAGSCLRVILVAVALVFVLAALPFAFFALAFSGNLSPSAGQQAHEEVRDAMRRDADAFGLLAASMPRRELRASLARGDFGELDSVVGSTIAELETEAFRPGQGLVYRVDVDTLTITEIALGNGTGGGFGYSSASAFGCAELTAQPESDHVEVRRVDCADPVLSGIGAHWGEEVDAT